MKELLLIALALALSACAASETLLRPVETLNIVCATNQVKLCTTYPAGRRLYECWCAN